MKAVKDAVAGYGSERANATYQKSNVRQEDDGAQGDELSESEKEVNADDVPLKDPAQDATEPSASSESESESNQVKLLPENMAYQTKPGDYAGSVPPENPPFADTGAVTPNKTDYPDIPIASNAVPNATLGTEIIDDSKSASSSDNSPETWIGVSALESQNLAPQETVEKARNVPKIFFVLSFIVLYLSLVFERKFS
ncbi:unnamed protein product [Anisakis simplex]|uniref:Trans-sialidase n=1 Tax=Anisakis simplex TaxID=6269 RepID=A0A0M3JBR8_ANISI|nr:unnamed protein product [Anisakis simplex]